MYLSFFFAAKARYVQDSSCVQQLLSVAETAFVHASNISLQAQCLFVDVVPSSRSAVVEISEAQGIITSAKADSVRCIVKTSANKLYMVL